MSTRVQRIEAATLIPGTGSPIRDGVVILERARIRYAGASAAAPTTPDAHVTTTSAVMPGMWEAHAHFYGTTGLTNSDDLLLPSEVAVVRAAQDIGAALDGGFTSAREAGGGLGFALATLVDEGTVRGPKIYPSGPFLSHTGGHGDHHEMPSSWVMDLCSRGGNYYLADGVPACLLAVRQQLRRGARTIKVCTSGGVASLRDHPQHQQFSDEELRAIVDEAARADVGVMAHAHGKRGIDAALRAGCLTIEHGSYLDEDSVQVMVDQGTLLVPTRLVIERLLARRSGIAPHMHEQILELADRHFASIQLAHSAGVKIAVGTDVAHRPGSQSVMPWGTSAWELVHLVEAGLSPLEAVEAATAHGPLTLGAQAPQSGRLEAGFDADVIAVSKNPLVDISVLTDASNITNVWQAGEMVKGQ